MPPAVTRVPPVPPTVIEVPPVPPAVTSVSPEEGSSSSKLTCKLEPLPLPSGSIKTAVGVPRNPDPGLIISNPITEDDIGLIIGLITGGVLPDAVCPKIPTKGGPPITGPV